MHSLEHPRLCPQPRARGAVREPARKRVHSQADEARHCSLAGASSQTGAHTLISA